MGLCPKPRKGFSPLTSVGRTSLHPCFCKIIVITIFIMREYLKGVLWISGLAICVSTL